MHQQWQSFCDQIGATLTPDGDAVFGDGPLDESVLERDFICPLPYYQLVGISGQDSAKFLQGQITCNLKDVTAARACYGAYCTPKGRMVTSFLLASRDEQHYFLRLYHDIAPATLETVGKYILFAKAEATDLGERFLLFGLSGPGARDRIQNQFGTAPEGRHGTCSNDDALVVQLDEAGQRYECWLAQERAGEIWTHLSEGLPAVDSRYWRWQSIRAGTAEVREQTRELFIPQMLNYQATGAVSFVKGCYTGQEVVARMQYRGQLKRRTYRARAQAENLREGQALHSPDKRQSIGNIVNAVALGDGSSEILAVITNEAASQNAVLVDENGPQLELLDLPYAINKES